MKESRYNVWTLGADAAVVFNGISGALLRISKVDYDALHLLLGGAEVTDCSPRVLAHLAQGRMLVPDDADEVELLADRYHSSRYDTNSFALTVVTSLGCNFDCPYCFEAKHPSIMDPRVQELVLQVLDDQLPNIHSFSVTWFGGEPLVGKKPLLALSDAFIERCNTARVEYSASIVTNGYLLDESTCAQLRDRGVRAVQVGLDGPPDVHDRMRPLADGRGSFWQIVNNLHHAVNFFSVSARVNVDTENAGSLEELFHILVEEGLAGKLNVYPGQLVAVTDNPLAPSARYAITCFTNPEFAQVERRFVEMAVRHGLTVPSLPRPTGAPCTAVRANELVVGSRGELYKCWDSVGSFGEVIGHISDYKNLNGRLAKWLKYDPFSNDECRGCIALPVCMGGCAHHAFDAFQYENRCGTFRHTYLEQVEQFVKFSAERGGEGLAPAARLARQMETR
jgi:uncharacterized protein